MLYRSHNLSILLQCIGLDYCFKMQCLLLFLFLCVLSCCGSTDGAASITKTIFVDQNGSGNFTTIQAAIDSIPDDNQQWIQIYVKQGTYREKVHIPENKEFIVLQGEGSQYTSIEWNDGCGSNSSLWIDDTMSSSTFAVFANNFVAKDIAFVNSFNKDQKGLIQQAVAALVGGDMISFYRCAFIGYQDTLCDYQGRHYFSDCWIEGAVDFIFGYGQSIYSSCVLNSIGEGWLTAHAKVNPDSLSGYVFKYCTIKATNMTYLGRAWNQYSTVVFYQTTMPATIWPQGWDAWRTPPNQNLTTYAEAGCIGPGANTTLRVDWQKHLTPDELNHFASIDFIGTWKDQQPF